MKRFFAGFAMASAVVVATPAMAGGQWIVNPAVGYQGFDGDRDLDEATTGIIGLEKQLSDQWGVELKYMYTSADNNYNVKAQDVDLQQGSIDVLRYLGGEKWKPYLALGLGHADFENDLRTTGETQANAGGGVRYAFDQSWSARFDARVINSLDNEQTDGIVSLGVSYAFGGSDASPKAAPAPLKPTEKDTDGDGVGDTRDRCAGTPVGVVVNASGCPLDSDGDGVPDYMDKCPKTPAGRQVDDQGCKFVLSRTEQIRMEVNFASNSADVPDAYLPEIEKVAKFLKQYGGVSAVVEGHSDASGSDAYNKVLSQRRADAVKAELVTRYGIDASRLTAIGYGEERPIASNDTREGRRENRRVVAVLKAEVSE
mgnify:CR=1 FL=1